jgi:anaerobic ribonucleoside-triphosphate reductase activating protein
MNICGYIKESISEGLGLRTVIFISGCKHGCEGCHSPQTHNFKYGEEFTLEKQLEIIEEYKKNPLLDGLTLCGGDVFFSAKEVVEFVELFKSKVNNINIWSYTGFTFEEILNSNNKDMIELLKLCDVIIDGKFVNEQKDLTLPFKGSRNQRIIDVKKSLEQDKVIEI